MLKEKKASRVESEFAGFIVLPHIRIMAYFRLVIVRKKTPLQILPLIQNF